VFSRLLLYSKESKVKLYKKFNHVIMSFLLTLIGCGGSTTPVIQPEPIPKQIVVVPTEVINTVKVIAPKPPSQILIKSVEYDLNEMKIIWYKSNEDNFKSYSLFQYFENPKSAIELKVYNSINDTIFVLNSFDPTKRNNFYVVNENISKLKTKGDTKSNIIEMNKPQSSTLFEVQYSNDLIIKWTMNGDNDFGYYEILKSINQDMAEAISVKKVIDREDTSYVIPMNSVYFYQILTEDRWGLKSFSNIVKGDVLINALGEKLSLIETRSVDLSNRNLVGNIPKDIAKLINLKTLKLNNNFLDGPIPSFIYQMKNLEFINLSNNSFNGTISSEIESLSNLKELWISNNEFSGKIPVQIGQLRKLVYLNFSKNDFEGTIPESIGSLKELKYLNGWSNNLTGFLPASLGDLNQLEFLSFGSNALFGEIPPNLGDAKKLKSIGLFENKFIGTIPEELASLPLLTYLGLFDNNLDGAMPDSFFRKGRLSYLKLNNNNFTDLDNELICKSGINWDNDVFFDISKNNIANTNNKCAHGIDFHEIYNSY
jgi:Leucine-rich repeat (LRR) protein